MQLHATELETSQKKKNQIPFNRPVILGDPSVLMGGDKHIISWIQTSNMIGRQIIVRG